MPRRVINLTGQRFGRLTAIAPWGRRGHTVLWTCECDCTAFVEVSSGSLRRSGGTRSCGCLRAEKHPNRTGRGQTTHGQTGSPAYQSWQGMNRRCGTTTTNGYEHYGGRGITICERWRNFAHFLADMGERPAGTSLDRIDVDGNYEPGNCRWATEREQQLNRRPRKLSPADVAWIKDELRRGDLTHVAMAARLGIHPSTISRIARGQIHTGATA